MRAQCLLGKRKQNVLRKLPGSFCVFDLIIIVILTGPQLPRTFIHYWVPGEINWTKQFGKTTGHHAAGLTRKTETDKETQYLFLMCWGGPRHLKLPSTIMASRVHRASHSSMLWGNKQVEMSWVLKMWTLFKFQT